MFLSIWDGKCNNGAGHPVITSNLHFTLSAHFEAKIKIFIASLALFGLTRNTCLILCKILCHGH